MWDLRAEEPPDVGAVRVVHESAFAPRRDEADLVDALRAAGDLVSELCLVALHAGSIVGHIAFSRAQLDSGHPVLALAPVGVLHEHQRQGAGSALVSEGLSRAGRTDFPLVVVLGHAGYYPRFGFGPADPLGVQAPFPVPPESWMAYRLPAYRSEVRGTIVDPEAFGSLA